MTWLGALGAPVRVAVDERGTVAGGDLGALGWLVGADRWLDPRVETTVRQRLVSQTPVVETLLRAGAGDVIWRTYVVADRGGALVVELDNQIAVPVAIAVWRRGSIPVVSARPPSTEPVTGIALEPGTVVFPVPHGTTWRGAVPLGPGSTVGPGQVPGLPSPSSVAAGWVAHVDAGVRVDAPFVAELMAERCQLLLRDDAARLVSLLQWGFERQAIEDLPGHAPAILEHWRLHRDVALARATAAVVAKRLTMTEGLSQAGYRAAAGLLDAAGERRGADDVRRLAGRLDLPDRPASSGPLDRMRDVLVDDWGDALAIVPGWPREWDGTNVEVHGLPTGFGRVSYAVRWHGERPALLWELEPHDPSFVITAPGLSPAWQSSEQRGEALLSPR